MTTPRIRFDWVISFGHIITLVGAIGVVAVGYLDQQRDVQEHERRLDVVEAQVSLAQARLAAKDVLEAQTRAQIDRLEELMGEVRDELRQINRRAAP